MKVSLIVATLGRLECLGDLLSSLYLAKKNLLSLDDIEVIIVDQNDINFGLKLLVDEYIDKMNIVYVHSDKQGLSYNRNLGLELASGDIVAFPDDDCTYYEDTLVRVLNAFDVIKDVDVFLGRIYDRSLNVNVIKKWPSVNKRINKFNYYFYSSSITVFAKRSNIIFDVNLGAGSKNGSCEDPDFLYRHLKLGSSIIYDHNIEVNHPIPSALNFNLDKVFKYASGFGFMIRKNFDFHNFTLFLLVIFIKPFQVLLNREMYKKGYFTSFYSGVFNGFFNAR